MDLRGVRGKGWPVVRVKRKITGLPKVSEMPTAGATIAEISSFGIMDNPQQVPVIDRL